MALVVLGISNLEAQPSLQCQFIQTSKFVCKHVIASTLSIMTQHISLKIQDQ